MSISQGFIGAIGNTPMIRLESLSRETGCEILGKAEFMNPGGSVKDRAALYIIKDAEEHGALSAGGTVVEGTAGNTGIGLAHICNARGYRCIIVIPETQSEEKKDMLRLCGAELKEVPAVPYKDPNNYVHVSGRLAEELNAKEPNGAIWARQFDNQANRRGHYRTTGPEIWEQTEGKLDGFVCAVGTGGTLAGVGMFLKEQNPDIKIGLADPPGAALYNYYKYGELKAEFYAPATLDDRIRREWMRIPHFYFNYYVFQYATGISAAAALVDDVLETGEPAAERYLDYLRSGSADYPLELLRDAGVDMATADPVERAIGVYDGYLDEMAALID